MQDSLDSLYSGCSAEKALQDEKRPRPSRRVPERVPLPEQMKQLSVNPSTNPKKEGNPHPKTSPSKRGRRRLSVAQGFDSLRRQEHEEEEFRRERDESERRRDKSRWRRREESARWRSLSRWRRRDESEQRRQMPRGRGRAVAQGQSSHAPVERMDSGGSSKRRHSPPRERERGATCRESRARPHDLADDT